MTRPSILDSIEAKAAKRDQGNQLVMRYHGGHIWSEIRSALFEHRERLVQAFDAGSYERESALLDDIARRITAEVEPMIETFSEKKRTK